MNTRFVPRWIADLGEERIDELLAAGGLRVYGNTIVPVIGGGDGSDEPLFPEIPGTVDDRAATLAALSDDELRSLENDLAATLNPVLANPSDYVTEDLTAPALLDACRAAAESLRAVRAELSTRDDEDDEDEPEVDETAASADDLAADFAALGDEIADVVEETPAEPDVEETPAVEPEPVAAAATATPPARAPLPPPRRARSAIPQPEASSLVPLVAAVPGPGVDVGGTFSSKRQISEALLNKRVHFGNVAKGATERITVARASWLDRYRAENRFLGRDEIANMGLVAAATDPAMIQAEMERRKNAPPGSALTASGGYCAVTTPRYDLQFIATTDRPVRDSLPSFGTDRGGIRYPRPAGLGAITDAIGEMTSENDTLGGTFATKTCQVIDCPDFEETLAVALYHCLQFGNMGAMAFPELLDQWQNLVMAAQARQAESFLLTGIDTASTAVTAGDLGLGASAALLPQILTAANGLRNRNRMSREAVLRLYLPAWAVDLIISDIIRTQFQRFDTDAGKVRALLRTFNVEPTFYLDGAAGAGQVFGAQTTGSLLAFPGTVRWYLFPEGTFLYLDGGQLELGLVRDSILNQTNDFQLFGETFENVAYVGIESLAVTSTVCDSGVVALPDAPTTCGSY